MKDIIELQPRRHLVLGLWFARSAAALGVILIDVWLWRRGLVTSLPPADFDVPLLQLALLLPWSATLLVSWIPSSTPLLGRYWVRLLRQPLGMLFGWSLVAALLFDAPLSMYPMLPRWWTQTPLESANFAAFCLAMSLLLAGAGLAIHGSAGLMARMRRVGVISQRTASDVGYAVSLAGGLMVPCSFILIDVAEPDARVLDFWVFLGTPPLLYCLVRTALSYPLTVEFSFSAFPIRLRRLATPVELQPKSIWLVFDRPLTTRRDRTLVNQIDSRLFARRARLTLAAPQGTTLVSDHVFYAEALRKLHTLYPVTAAELPDWRVTLPPPDRNYALLFRQLHPEAELLEQAVTTLRDPADEVILVANRDTNLERWRGKLPAQSTRVLWVDTESPGAAANVGYPIFVWNGEDRLTEFEGLRERNTAHDYYESALQAQRQGDFTGAEQWYLKLLPLLEQAENTKALCSVYHQLGLIGKKRADFSQAARWYRRSLAIEQQRNDAPGAAISYHQLGWIAENQREFAAAEQLYLSSLAIEEQLDNDAGRAITFHQLGRIAHVQGKLAAADHWYRRSLGLEEKLGNKDGIALTSQLLGKLLQTRGEPAAAEQYWSMALALDEDLGNHPRAAQTRHLLVQLATAQGDHLTAARGLVKVIEHFAQLGDQRLQLSQMLQQLAACLPHLAEPERAELARRWTAAGLQQLADFATLEQSAVATPSNA